MITAKLHKTPTGSSVLAMCDSNLLGKKIFDGKLFLSLSEHFYKGKEYSEEEIVHLIKSADSFNLSGEESVRIGIKAGIIDKKNVRYIKKIPHAVAVRG